MNRLEQPIERRKRSMPMSSHDFQDLVLKRLDAGEGNFTRITDHLQDMSQQLATVSSRLDENTMITAKTQALAQQTATDTADLIAFDKTLKRGAGVVISGARGIDKGRKLLMPFFWMIGAVTVMWHGIAQKSWPSIKDFWDFFK